MDRDEVLASIDANVQEKDMRQHMLATEAVMRAMARSLGEDEDEWGFTGLLHDIDVELVEDDPDSHSKLGADIAEELGATEAMCHAILSHNEAHDIPRETKLDKALFCADQLSGLIIATALAHGGELKGLTAKSVLKRFNEKGFAPGVKRERIGQCQQIGLGLEELVALGLKATKEIAADLEL